MKLNIQNVIYDYEDGITLEKISKDFPGDFICAKVNGRIRELTFKMNFDANVEFLGVSDPFGMIIYKSTLRYIIAMAMHNVFPLDNIRFSNSISMSMFAKIIGKNIKKEELEKIEEEVNRIISCDYKLERKKYSIDEMNEYYKNLGYFDKVENLKYRKESVNVYEANGYRNYMFSYMAPSTAYIKNFKFIIYYPGFIVQFPRSESDGKIPEFSDEPRFLKTLANANKWANLTETENIYDINKKIKDKDELIKFINICETKHYHDIEEIGSKIEKNIEDIRLIAIAGPSSSGKTTFSKKLEVELLTRNIKPLRISLDNYYLPPELNPKLENGKPDFEHIESLNINLFNDNMRDFVDGKEVRLPIFNFKTKETTFMEPIKLEKDSVIIIEGIHALNDRLTESIPRENKFKIYICPLFQRNIDNHNPISLTDLRLIRRIVRDKKQRNYSASDTIKMWPMVRNGERKWIYPFMEGADYIFNSELGYELLSLKNIGLKALKEVKYDSEEYVQANLLIKFLKIYENIDENLIPNNSLIREFIGNSVFEDID